MEVALEVLTEPVLIVFIQCNAVVKSSISEAWAWNLDGQLIIPSGKSVNLSVPQFLNLYSKDNNTYPGGIVTRSMWNNICKAFRVVPGT